jgi:arylsulfatase A-like enzyme
MNFKNLCIYLPVICALSSCKGNEKSADKDLPENPNILFIAIDDLRPELGCYGNDYIKSPNIDRLAETGAVFTNHFVQVPTCGASRYSLLTGMLPKTKGHLSNEACRNYIAGKPETDSPETFIHHLRRNGYYTVGIGKISHYVDGLLYGYTDPVGKEYELPHSWDEMLLDAGKWGTGWNAFFGYADGENRQSMNKQVKPYEMADVPDTGYPDGLITDQALGKLRELAKKDAPFFLGVGFFKPHLPFNAPKKYWDMYNEEEIPLSPNPYIPENVNKASLHGSGEFNGYQLGDEKASLEGPVSDEYARKLRHAYFACVSYIDAQVGKLLAELEEQGLSENTVVVIWGDHGWHLGDHLVWGKHTIFDRALKSAFIVNVPGKTEGNSITKIVSTTDIYPTLIELSGIEMPHQTDGRSLVPLINNSAIDWEEASYGYFRNGVSLRTGRYRLTKYFRDDEPSIELFDYQNDPHETVNIADENSEVVDQLLLLWEKGNTGLYENEQKTEH